MADENPVEIATTSKGESSESTVEINVKTLDSQIYSLQVDKNMPVPLLKEKVANAAGVPVEQQRLIFRGKVLKDEHLLSEYHVEDGHTLHLVVRQPVQSQTAAETNGNNANHGNEASSGAPRNMIGQVSHSVVLGTFNVGDQGEAVGPDLNRIIGAVLNSIGIGNQIPTGGASNISTNIPSNASSQASQGAETNGARDSNGGRSQTGQGQPGQALPNHPFQSMSQSFQFPSFGGSVAGPPQTPIPDALHTLSEFINRMEQALSDPGHQPSPSTNVGQPQTGDLPSNDRGLPTPGALSIIVRRAQQLLSGHAAAALSRLAERLEGEGSSTDPAVRSQIQTESAQVGLAMHHLGALFLELGRTILTLRMGQLPAESLVNAGPAVYISPSGPNPIMVQPFPLQTSSLFGGSVSSQANSGIMAPAGHGDTPRNISIHIHAVGSRENTGDASHEEHPNGTHSGNSGSTRVLPVRNIVATAGPSRSPAETANHVLNSLLPQTRTAQNNPSQVAPAQNSGVAASTLVQPTVGNSVPQPVSESAALPTFVAEINAQIRNLVDNMRGENQVPSGGAEDSTLQGSSVNVGDDQHENLAVSGAQQTSGSSTDYISEPKEQQNPETSGNVGAEDVTSISSTVCSLSRPNVETTLTGNSENCSEGAPNDNQSQNPGGDKAAPLGLGLGGLQPRRRSRQSKEARSQGKNSGGTSNNSTVNQKQQSVSGGQLVLQSLLSNGSDANMRSTSGSSGQLPPVFSQIMESMPVGASGSTGQLDAASMMSQVLNSPALNGLLAGVSEQAGIGSPDGLRNMLEQFTQSPSMRNTLNRIVQQIDDQDIGNFPGMGRGQSGGLDLSRMVQQMMPIVSQALTRGSTNPGPLSPLEPEEQRQSNMSSSVRDEKPDDRDCQIDLQQTTEAIERHDPPGDIFRSVVQHVGTVDSVSEDLIEDLCRDEDLANEFVAMLQQNIRQRLQSDLGFTEDSSI